ncbi:PREDICTED: uncharacterized protein LOC108775291 [Cyphomyrmex costatus]|uniref:uncharacterized protein LOC108775291 n=1 Tax=Cyphomyrmex costatus TaxID=456900 RepID=UPI0008523076|nr:PREDICTED: uncharacterized protein LOC108775291 [Cyphomyrmex costatus]
MVKECNAEDLSCDTSGDKVGVEHVDVKVARPVVDVPKKEVPWTRIVGRRQRRSSSSVEIPQIKQRAVKPGTGRKITKLSAIQIACREGTTYAEAMRVAKAGVDIKPLKIGDIFPRKTRTGDLLLELGGEDSSSKADHLATKLKEVLKDKEG